MASAAVTCSYRLLYSRPFFRFSSSESLKIFGSEKSVEYRTKVQKYRQWTIEKLVSMTNKFIENIHAHIHCFPSSICYLVKHIYQILTAAGKLQDKQVHFVLVLQLSFF